MTHSFRYDLVHWKPSLRFTFFLRRQNYTILGRTLIIELKNINPLSASVPSFRNLPIDLHSKSIDWFLFEGNSGT